MSMLLLAILGSYTVLNAGFSLYLYLISDTFLIGQDSKGEVVSSGKARLKRDAFWQAGKTAMDTLPLLMPNNTHCHYIKESGCYTVGKMVYWLDAAKTVPLKSRCHNKECKTILLLSLLTDNGIPVQWEKSDTAYTSPKDCAKASKEVQKKKVDVPPEKKMWYIQIFVKTTFTEKHTKLLIRRTVPLLDEKCRPQYIYGFVQSKPKPQFHYHDYIYG
ncbi:hypothetical protein DSO57_1032544 [Entomophthora muscae]|uniref:Uncharacterized protein n=1 Tax=Entomophthora muscae TaxID=34485 RepID=A0ACC2UK90_9FUNG|nr:hypothetical protein DSO57_1032544 [Entomophthora muscae]